MISRNRMYWHVSLAAALTLTSLMYARAAEPAKKPNIVYIVADDLGRKDVGFNGCADIKTPNLDKLAATGVRFTQFYAQPMCTPTRAALHDGSISVPVWAADDCDTVGLHLWIGDR